jgi:hypothetical protein
LAQNREDLAPELRRLVQAAHTVLRQQHFPGRLHLASADPLTSEMA